MMANASPCCLIDPRSTHDISPVKYINAIVGNCKQISTFIRNKGIDDHVNRVVHFWNCFDSHYDINYNHTSNITYNILFNNFDVILYFFNLHFYHDIIK